MDTRSLHTSYNDQIDLSKPASYFSCFLLMSWGKNVPSLRSACIQPPSLLSFQGFYSFIHFFNVIFVTWTDPLNLGTCLPRSAHTNLVILLLGRTTLQRNPWLVTHLCLYISEALRFFLTPLSSSFLVLPHAARHRTASGTHSGTTEHITGGDVKLESHKTKYVYQPIWHNPGDFGGTKIFPIYIYIFF